MRNIKSTGCKRCGYHCLCSTCNNCANCSDALVDSCCDDAVNYINDCIDNLFSDVTDQTPDMSNDPEANELIEKLDDAMSCEEYCRLIDEMEAEKRASEAQKRQYKSLVEQMDDILSEAEEKRFEAYLVKHFKKNTEFVETKEHLQYGIVFDLLTDIQNSNNTDNEEFDRIQKAIDILVDL